MGKEIGFPATLLSTGVPRAGARSWGVLNKKLHWSSSTLDAARTESRLSTTEVTVVGNIGTAASGHQMAKSMVYSADSPSLQTLRLNLINCGLKVILKICYTLIHLPLTLPFHSTCLPPFQLDIRQFMLYAVLSA